MYGTLCVDASVIRIDGSARELYSLQHLWVPLHSKPHKPTMYPNTGTSLRQNHSRSTKKCEWLPGSARRSKMTSFSINRAVTERNPQAMHDVGPSCSRESNFMANRGKRKQRRRQQGEWGRFTIPIRVEGCISVHPLVSVSGHDRSPGPQPRRNPCRLHCSSRVLQLRMRTFHCLPYNRAGSAQPAGSIIGLGFAFV